MNLKKKGIHSGAKRKMNCSNIAVLILHFCRELKYIQDEIRVSHAPTLQLEINQHAKEENLQRRTIWQLGQSAVNSN